MRYAQLFQQKGITLKDLDLNEAKLLQSYQKYKCKKGEQNMTLSEYVQQSGVDLNQFDLVRQPRKLPYINPVIDPVAIMDFDELSEIESLEPEMYHDKFSSYLDNPCGIRIVNQSQNIRVRKVARRLTTYEYTRLMLKSAL